MASRPVNRRPRATENTAKHRDMAKPSEGRVMTRGEGCSHKLGLDPSEKQHLTTASLSPMTSTTQCKQIVQSCVTHRGNTAKDRGAYVCPPPPPRRIAREVVTADLHEMLPLRTGTVQLAWKNVAVPKQRHEWNLGA